MRMAGGGGSVPSQLNYSAVAKRAKLEFNKLPPIFREILLHLLLLRRFCSLPPPLADCSNYALVNNIDNYANLTATKRWGSNYSAAIITLIIIILQFPCVFRRGTVWIHKFCTNSAVSTFGSE